MTEEKAQELTEVDFEEVATPADEIPTERPASNAPEVRESRPDRGETIDVSGDWIGTVYGTNVGNAYARFEQNGAELTGEARFMDDRLGPTAYAVSGTARRKVELTLTPTTVPDNITASVVTGTLELGMDGKLHGRWTSEVGTGGVLALNRYLMPSQLKGGIPEQGATAPTRIYNANRSIGAVRLDRDDLRRLVDVVQRDFTIGRAVVTYTPRGGSQRSEYASTLLADEAQTDALESITISVQEAEPNNINRGVNVDLVVEGASSIRTYGSVESWVVGKAETVATEMARHKRALITGYKRYGLDFNAIVLLAAIVFLPDSGALSRFGYLAGVLAIVLALRYFHARMIPMTDVRLGPAPEGFFSRYAIATLSWLLAIASAVAIKVLSDVLSGSPILKQFTGWFSRIFGVDTPEA